MGFFSFLGKKDRRKTPSTSDFDTSRQKQDDEAVRYGGSPATTSPNLLQRDAARQTVLKIDAIESEMSSELIRTQSLGGNSKPLPRTPQSASPTRQATASASPGQPDDNDFPVTQTLIGRPTDFLLGGAIPAPSSALASPEAAAVIEEAAILFANGQNALAETTLLEAIHGETLEDATRTAWWMLFDLYQITERQPAFERLAADYATAFETSPPTWVALEAEPLENPAVAALSLSGQLDEMMQAQLELAVQLATGNPVLQLGFDGISAVTPAGCALLLTTLKTLQRLDCDLVLIGAGEFARTLRASLQVGQPGESEAAWLLLLEILQESNRQQDFEEASIDYCITFEVSPPAFVAPPAGRPAAAAAGWAPNVFMMPSRVEGKTDLIEAITQFATQHNPAIIDCARLKRVDFGAAGQLISALAPLIGPDRVIELHNVNQLVSALFNVMGLREITRLHARKQ